MSSEIHDEKPGLLRKNVDGEYQVHPDADLGFLQNYLFFEHGVIPRITFYASFVTVLFIVYGILVPFDFGAHNVFALVLGISSISFFWMEVIRHYRSLK